MAPIGEPPVDIPKEIPNKIGIKVPSTNESPIPAIGPINPALISLMVSPSISFLLALASSILAVTPTMTVPSIGFVLKKAVYA